MKFPSGFFLIPFLIVRSSLLLCQNNQIRVTLDITKKLEYSALYTEKGNVCHQRQKPMIIYIVFFLFPIFRPITAPNIMHVESIRRSLPS